MIINYLPCADEDSKEWAANMAIFQLLRRWFPGTFVSFFEHEYLGGRQDPGP